MIYEEKIHEKKALFKNNGNLCKDVWNRRNAGAVTVSESGWYIPDVLQMDDRVSESKRDWYSSIFWEENKRDVEIVTLRIKRRLWIFQYGSNIEDSVRNKNFVSNTIFFVYKNDCLNRRKAERRSV